MKNWILIIALSALWPGYVYGQINQDVVNSDVPGGGGGGGGDGLSASDIDTITKLNNIISPDVLGTSSSQSITNKNIDCNGNTCKPLRGDDCTAFDAATGGQYCVDTDDLVIYFCSVGTEEVCDAPGEWVAVSSASSAAGVTNVPAGNIAATDVQAALNELDTEKQAAGTYSGTGSCTNQVVTALNSGAAPTCTTLSDSYLPDTITANITGNLTGTASDLSCTGCVADSELTSTFLKSTNIDTFAELDTIVADEALVTEDNTQTLTNKTISGSSNTLSNIPWSALINVPAFRKTLFQLRPQANEPPASSFATMNTRNSHPALRFNGNVCAIWSFVMPNWYGGNGVTVDIFYVSTETSNDTDWDVSMELIGTSQDIDSDSFASAISGDNNNNNATSGIPTKVSVALTSGAQMDSCVADSLCRVRVCRDDTSDTGGADTIDFIGGQIRETP